MTTFATANYHVSSPERQAFHIDADGVSGNIIGPELVPPPVHLHDLRETDGILSFAKDSLAFANFPTSVVTFDHSNDWKEIYNQELSNLLMRETGAKEVIIFDHTVRVDDENAKRKPARNVHGDYSARGAHQRLVDLLGPKAAKEWQKGHFAFINTWRPFNNPINSTPLGFVLPQTVKPEDWVDIDLIYPDRRGHILGLVHNKDHEWVYLSKMTPDEIAYFNVYDNQGKLYIAHSALEFVEDTSVKTTRMSIESRTLVRYD